MAQICIIDKLGVVVCTFTRCREDVGLLHSLIHYMCNKRPLRAVFQTAEN